MPKNWLQQSFDPDAYNEHMRQEQRNKQHQTDIFRQIFGLEPKKSPSNPPTATTNLSSDAKTLVQHIERIIRVTNTHFKNLKPFKPSMPAIIKGDIIDFIATNGPHALDFKLEQLGPDEWQGTLYLTDGTQLISSWDLYRAAMNQMLQQISEGLMELLGSL